MKLNRFLEKAEPKPRKKPTSYTLSNEAKENKLQKKIDLLNQKLERYKNVEADFIEERKQNTIYKDSSVELNNQIADLQEEGHRLKIRLDDTEPKAALLQQVQKSLTEAEDRYASNITQLNEIKLSKKTQEKNIAFLTKERVSLQKDYADETAKNTKLKTDFEKITNKASKIEKQYAETQSLVDELRKIREEQEKTMGQMKVEVDYYQTDATGARKYMDDIERKRDGLVDLIKELKSQTSSKTSQTKFLANKLTDAETTIVELEQVVNDSREKIDYYTALATAYKLELDKPRYMSLAAISRKEGFSIPGLASAKNYNKLHLGNAKPTLLKFK